MHRFPALVLPFVFLLAANGAFAQQTPRPDSQQDVYVGDPVNGYVPDAVTAQRIAEAVWLPIYGKQIYHNRPFVATLTPKGIWKVEGTLPKGYDGGVPYIEIRQRDCQILKVTHGK